MAPALAYALNSLVVLAVVSCKNTKNITKTSTVSQQPLCKMRFRFFCKAVTMNMYVVARASSAI
jgi:hypothetical protein